VKIFTVFVFLSAVVTVSPVTLAVSGERAEFRSDRFVQKLLDGNQRRADGKPSHSDHEDERAGPAMLSSRPGSGQHPVSPVSARFYDVHRLEFPHTQQRLFPQACGIREMERHDGCWS
jgi:hypothetical protein